MAAINAMVMAAPFFAAGQDVALCHWFGWLLTDTIKAIQLHTVHEFCKGEIIHVRIQNIGIE
jgi:hypothetical protein